MILFENVVPVAKLIEFSNPDAIDISFFQDYFLVSLRLFSAIFTICTIAVLFCNSKHKSSPKVLLL